MASDPETDKYKKGACLISVWGNSVSSFGWLKEIQVFIICCVLHTFSQIFNSTSLE